MTTAEPFRRGAGRQQLSQGRVCRQQHLFIHWPVGFITCLVVVAFICSWVVLSRVYGTRYSNCSQPTVTTTLVTQQISTPCSMTSMYAPYAIWPFRLDKCRAAARG